MRIRTEGTHLAMRAVVMLALLMHIGPGSAIVNAQSLPELAAAPSSVFPATEMVGSFPAGDSLVLRSSWEPWNLPTLILQPVLGTATGMLGLGIGFISAMNVRGCSFGGCKTGRTTGTDILEFGSIFGFGILGLATGISLGGDIAGADGDFGLTLAGSAAGIGLGTVIITALPPETDPARGIAAFLVMIASPLIVYNLTAEAEPLPSTPDSDSNAPDGRPEYLRPHRGESHSVLLQDALREHHPMGAGEDRQEITFSIPLSVLVGEH